MKLNGKTLKSDVPVDVPIVVGGENQALRLYCKAPTSKDYIQFVVKANAFEKTNYVDAYRFIAEWFTGWEDVADEKGEEIPFSVDKLVEFQENFLGLTESIMFSLDEAIDGLRGKLYSQSAVAMRKSKKKK